MRNQFIFRAVNLIEIDKRIQTFLRMRRHRMTKHEQWIPLMEKPAINKSALSIYSSLSEERQSQPQLQPLVKPQSQNQPQPDYYQDIYQKQHKRQSNLGLNPYYSDEPEPAPLIYSSNDFGPSLEQSPETHKNSKKLPFSDYGTGNSPRKESEIIHIVHPDDTLEGLSLVYGVSISQIKQRNKIDTDSIHYLKKMYIPNPTLEYTPPEITEDYKVSHVMGFLNRNDRSKEIAWYYLDDNQWNIETAVQAYKKDIEWDKHSQIKSIPASHIPNGRLNKWMISKTRETDF